MADKIVAQYIVKTDKAIKNLDKLEKEVKDLSKQGKKAAKDIEGNFKKTSSSLVSQFSKVGAALGVAFGAQQLVQFGKEAVTLASQMEGVERAFKRIGGANSANLLDGLRKATRGTVSDLVLMQKAVQASNFKIPLENLASLFKFAQARARETGESVEYLTNSIVLGIGRKSPLILDNLGISAVELRERLNGVGVEAANVGDIAQIIGDIAEEELAKMGDQADTTADKLAQMGTAYTNALTKGGEAIIQAGSAILDNFGIINENQATIDAFVASIQGLGSAELNAKLVQQLSEIESIRRRQTQLSKIDNKLAKESLLLEGDKLKANKELRGQVLKEQEDAGKAIIDKNDFVASLRKQLAITTDIVELGGDFESYTPDQINALSQANDELQETIKNLKFYNDLIAELQTKQKDANTTRAEVRQLEDDINEAIRQRLILLGRLREIGGASMEEIESIASMELLVQQELTDDIISDSERRNEEILKGKEELNAMLAEADKEDADNRRKILEASLSAALELTSTITNAIIAGQKAELSSLQTQLDQGQITREQYDEKRRKLERKSAIAAKNAAIFQAVINTALAVSNALNTVPFLPLGPVMAGIAAGLGAVQIGVITGTPLPTFAEGGWVDSKGKIHGNSHAQGGVKIEAEGDEFIVKGKHAKKNSGLLEALNAGSGQDWINKNMVYPAIQNVLDNGDSNSNQWNNLNVQFKDHNLISAMDRDRQANVRGLSMVNNTLNKLVKTQKRGGYNA